ncbi:MAG: hypothetical protein Q8N99_06565 [Nanoarchaeota archaeon]|nr:hypothetical protein [Nanoarchaeota archaeon]
MKIELDTQKLIDYFNAYNQSIRDVKGVKEDALIDTTSLDSIVTSIVSNLRRRANTLEEHYTHEARGDFCYEAMLYFLATGNVPSYNSEDIVNNSKEKTPFFIGKSLEAYTEKTRELRKPSKT